MMYLYLYATTRNTGDRCVVYSARGFLPCVVFFEGATIPTSKLDNCNDVGSQLPHRAHISRASCLKNPGERNDILEFCVHVQNV